MNLSSPQPDTILKQAGKIAQVDFFPVMLKLKKPLVMATYRLDNGPVAFIRVRSENGMEGWGEAAANILMSGETLAGMAAVLEQFIKPVLMTQSALDWRVLMPKLRQSMYGNGGILAAVEMALIDLVGKLYGIPAHALLGGKIRQSVPVLRLVGGSGKLDADVAESKELALKGYTAFKLKVGVSNIKNEIATIYALREELGQNALIAADANMGWNKKQTVEFLSGVQDATLAFLEQPAAIGDIDSLAFARSKTNIAISIDESMHGTYDLQSHTRAQAIDGVSLKTIKLGGLEPIISVANIAHGMGLCVNLAMMMESGLATAAMIHCGCVVPDISWGLSLGSQWIANDPFPAVQCIDGQVSCPDGPGWGVYVDEAMIRDLIVSF